MFKRLRPIVISLLIIAVAYGAIRLRSSLDEPPVRADSSTESGHIAVTGAASNPNGYLTLDWLAGGMTISYPRDWLIAPWDSDAESSQRLEFLSPRGSGGYFCVDLVLNPFASDIYRLQGGSTVFNFSRGLSLYQRQLAVGNASELEAWLTNRYGLSVVSLGNGTSLLAEIIYDCDGGDAETASLSYSQQEATSDYQAAVGIIGSVVSSTDKVN